VIVLLEVTREENYPDFLLSIVGDIARSNGMTQVANELNMSLKGLYKALVLHEI
jgi:DNA-binding phage protein